MDMLMCCDLIHKPSSGMHSFSPKIGGEYIDVPCCCARFMGWFGICRIILDSDADTIVGKVEMHGADADVPLSEQTISQALATAREHLARSLLK
jgi:hypothetical protein